MPRCQRSTSGAGHRLCASEPRAEAGLALHRAIPVLEELAVRARQHVDGPVVRSVSTTATLQIRKSPGTGRRCGSAAQRCPGGLIVRRPDRVGDVRTGGRRTRSTMPKFSMFVPHEPGGLAGVAVEVPAEESSTLELQTRLRPSRGSNSSVYSASASAVSFAPSRRRLGRRRSRRDPTPSRTHRHRCLRCPACPLPRGFHTPPVPTRRYQNDRLDLPLDRARRRTRSRCRLPSASW